jgi:spore coat protein U-like protein
MKNLKISLLAAAIALPFGAQAANDGTLGSTSTGDFEIIVALQDLVQISRLNDLDFGTYAGSGNLVGNEAFCVYRNGTGAYQATLTGDGTGGAFTIASGGNTIPYTVSYDDGGGAAAVTTGTLNTGLMGNATAADCGAADNTTVTITMTEAALQSQPTGTYQGTLTILIGPE